MVLQRSRISLNAPVEGCFKPVHSGSNVAPGSLNA